MENLAGILPQVIYNILKKINFLQIPSVPGQQEVLVLDKYIFTISKKNP
jgi:hypothetical protein